MIEYLQKGRKVSDMVSQRNEGYNNIIRKAGGWKKEEKRTLLTHDSRCREHIKV